MIKVKGRTIRATVLDMRNASLAARAAGRQAIIGMGRLAAEHIKKNMSSKAYTRKELNDLDHPYAQRHGRILIHQDRPWLVHDHGSKRLLKEMFHYPIRNKARGFGYEIRMKGEYSRFVIKGTRVMLPRDTLRATVNQPDVQKQMMDLGMKMIRAEFKRPGTFKTPTFKHRK